MTPGLRFSLVMDAGALQGRDRVLAIRGAARVLRPSNENTSGDLARFPGARGLAPSPNCTGTLPEACPA